MALSRQRAHERRMVKLAEENKDLAKDVSKLEDALTLHTQIQHKNNTSVRGIIRKEIGGSIWQHGGTGKLSTYKSSKDLGNKCEKKPVKLRSDPTTIKQKDALTLHPNVEKVHSKKPLVSGGSAIGAKLNQRATSISETSTPQDASENDTCVSTAIHTVSPEKSELNINVPCGQTVTLRKAKLGKPRPVSSARITGHKKSGDLQVISRPIESEVKSHTQNRVEILSKMINKLRESWQLDEDLSGTRKEKQIKSPKRESKTDTTRHAPKPWDPLVIDWLHSLNLKDVDKYAKLFMDHEIDMESVKLLTEKQLNCMGIVAVGTVAKLLNGIKQLEQSVCEPFAISNNICSPLTPNTHHDIETKSAIRVEKSKALDLDNFLGVTRVLSPSSITKPTISSANRDKLTKKPESKSVLKPNSRRPQSATQSIKGKESTLAKPIELATNRRASSAKDSLRSTNRSVSSSKPTVRSTRTSRIRALQDVSSPTRTAVQDVSPVTTDTDELLDKVAHANTPKLDNTALTIDGYALGAEQLANGGEEDAKLQQIENQIKSLCDEITRPGAIETITKLQEQLQDIQQQILERKSVVATEEGTKEKILEKEDEQQTTVNAESGFATKDEKVHKGKSAVLSQKMSKTELLKEVRKQKEIHRREIRHLESELSRLKHKDPLRSCEIMEDEVYYLPQDLIGEGAFSQVFRGFYQGSEVAIKQLNVPLSAQDKNYFMAEVNLLKDLRHPRVVLLVGVCTTSKLPLMVLEFMANASLYNYLHNTHNASLDHAAYYQIARDTALGMNYLHKHRPSVLHLDLKSMNILLTTHLRAKIADFGFSKLKHDANVAAKQSGKSKSTVKGTPAWLAPELLDNRDISTKADVYSFGVILHEMVTRTHPYPGCTVFQIIERVRNSKRPEIPQSCPKPLASLISRCWDKNPARRPSFKDVLITLEKLHFPTEWQTLFDKAGVPRAALDDPTTTRSLMHIVTQTLEGKIPRPADVPTLDLTGCGEDERDLVLQDIDDEQYHVADCHYDDVTEFSPEPEEQSYTEMNMPLRLPLTSGLTKRIDKPYASESDRNKLEQGDHKLLPTEKLQSGLPCDVLHLANAEETENRLKKLEESFSRALGYSSFDCSAPPMAPPPPPIISCDWGSNNHLPGPLKDEIFEDILDGEISQQHASKSKNRPRDVQPVYLANKAIVDNELRASQLVKQRNQLRSAVEPHRSEQAAIVKPKSVGPRASIRASMLNEQREKLLPTDDPHPHQLTDLSAVEEGQLSDLAAVLRRAVNERRSAMGNTATLDSVETTGWSLDEQYH